MQVKGITDCKKLVGYRNVYRIRIGNYKAFITFHVEIVGNYRQFLQHF
ncbi:MAG: hypothetical protein SPK22_07425 [Alloprevotella sp.]|nr:hypothetical protein [Bacteroidales bacterium]MDY5770020.1 hypothetical protein [Alloprevotella sp.]